MTRRNDPVVHMAEGGYRRATHARVTGGPSKGGAPVPPYTSPARRSLLPPGGKLLIVCAVAAVVFVVCMGCAPPRAQVLHGPAAFNAWLDEHGTSRTLGDLSHEPGAPCGIYYPAENRATTDPACIASYTDDPRQEPFVAAHEAGHALDIIGLHYSQGYGPCDPAGICQGIERAAQCIAEVVVGYASPIEGFNDSYWSCPAEQLDRTRWLMEQVGAW